MSNPNWKISFTAKMIPLITILVCICFCYEVSGGKAKVKYRKKPMNLRKPTKLMQWRQLGTTIAKKKTDGTFEIIVTMQSRRGKRKATRDLRMKPLIFKKKKTTGATSIEQKFLEHVLHKETVKKFEYGFFSRTDWEVYFQVVLKQHFTRHPQIKTKYKHVQRELPYTFWKTDSTTNQLKLSYGSIDFVLDGVAVEFKVETWKSNDNTFAGHNSFTAMMTDILKMKRQWAGDSQFYSAKWVVIIARSQRQRYYLAWMIDYINNIPLEQKGGVNSCWFLEDFKGYLAVLHRDEKFPGECVTQSLRKVSAYNPTNRGPFEKALDDPLLFDSSAKPAHCANDQPSPFATATNQEVNFLTLIKDDAEDYKNALPEKQKGDGKAWEKFAQVMISKRLQCDTTMKYDKKIREEYYDAYAHPYDYSADFWLKDEKVVIELKVEVQPKKLAGSLSLAKAIKDEMNKLEEWKNDYDKKWFIAIMDATTYNCNSLIAWGTGAPSSLPSCPPTWKNNAQKLGTRVVPDTESMYFEHSHVWVVTTSAPNDVLFILVCFQADDSPC